MDSRKPGLAKDAAYFGGSGVGLDGTVQIEIGFFLPRHEEPDQGGKSGEI